MKRSRLGLYAVAFFLYVLGAWFHFPYGGGHVYSDIVTVFQSRFCTSGPCYLGVPYVSVFVEYPILTALFMWTMGLLGNGYTIVAGSFLNNYYYFTCIFLAIPTFLLIRESLKIAESLHLRDGRVLLYVVATPSFIFMLLLNWYVIGVFFAVFALRKSMEGSKVFSGILFGLSAASNLVTAAPAIGVLFMLRSWKDRLVLVAVALATYGAINLPFMIANPTLWFRAWDYYYTWYIEGSWLILFTYPNIFSPLRHTVPFVVFGVLSLAILAKVWKEVNAAKLLDRHAVASEMIRIAWLFTFAYLFSTYIFTPQMNMILLPFFALAPITRRYWEFLVFDTVNSLVIVLGYSMTLPYLFGINHAFSNAGPTTIIPMLVIIRSLWVGKFVIVDGLAFPSRLKESENPATLQLGARTRLASRLRKLFHLVASAPSPRDTTG